LKLSNAILYIFLFFTTACNSNYGSNSNSIIHDSTVVVQYITKGNEIYATKTGYNAYTTSMLYYDSAWQIAQNSNSDLLIGASYFAKGRAYDAWNKEPQKTIEYYKLATKYYEKIPYKFERSLYLKHLVAHSYDKIKDSSSCITELTDIYKTIVALPDTTKQRLQFSAEMALISTEVKNYALADSILINITKRQWIQNDPETYDYLNHYYLTQSRINVYGKNNYTTPYLDSLEKVYKASKNLSDSIYFSDELRQIYLATNNSKKQSFYDNEYRRLFFIMNNPHSIAESQKKLDAIETAATEKEIKLVKQNLQIRKYITWALIAIALIISSLLYFLYKRNIQIQKKRNELYQVNNDLKEKSVQNELLNKEIHHRVKNNLQMIMSLVYMQERNSNDNEVKENMQNIRLRIESIANLHEQLMHQSDTIDLNSYIHQLVSNVSKLLNDNKNIITNLQIAPIQVSQKISFPLGLIINEWITNSVKYAATKGTSLEIGIEITNGNNQITINYKDNGIAQTNVAEKKSLGLNIVQLLVAQLNATLTTASNNDFMYNLVIPIV
jgi:two-component sensor histidine kinase